MLHLRLRQGSANTQRGILRFCDELIARVNRVGAEAPKLMRADSGFWNAKAFARLEQAGWSYSIGVRMAKHVSDVVDLIDEAARTTIRLPRHRRGADRRNRSSAPPGPCCAGLLAMPGRLTTTHAGLWTLTRPPAGPATTTSAPR